MSAVGSLTRRLLRGLYLALWAVVILALTVELGLVLGRRGRLDAARSFAATNPFESARDVTETGSQGLWLVPGERYRPGARLDLDLAGERYSIVINSLGFRTRDFEPHKPAGVFRVVCIGGSTTVQGRSNEQTYPAFLERRLRALHPEAALEVLNLGVSGTGSKFWMDRLGEVLALEPDVILHYEFVNDFFWTALPAYASRHPWLTAGRSQSLLLGLLLPPSPLDFEQDYASLLRRALRMKRTAAQEGAAYVSASFARPDARRAGPGLAAYLDVYTESWGGRHGLRRYADYGRILDAYTERQRVFAEESGLELAPVATIRDPALFVDLCHMTTEGIERLADAFVPLVTSRIGPR